MYTCKLFLSTVPRNLLAVRGIASIAAMLLLVSTSPSFADCPVPSGPSTPVTVNDESSSVAGSRQLVDGSGTIIDTGSPGKIKVNVTSATSPTPLTVDSFSAGGVFSPAPNTFTNVTNTTQVNLPPSGPTATGAVIGLAITGAQGTTNIVTNEGLGDEQIIFDGTNSGTIQLRNGEVIQLANLGAGKWVVIQFTPHRRPAAAGANTDISSLSGLTTALSVGQGGTGATNPQTARANLGAAAAGANSDITAITGLSTPLAVTQGGTGASTINSARSTLGAAASGANSDITSLSGLSTPLSPSQGGTGQNGYVKGDILVATNANTLAKLPKGSDGQYLTADSGTSTGLQWDFFPISTEVTSSTLGNYFGEATLGDQTYTGLVEVGDTTNDNDFVIVHYNNLTIQPGATLTTAARKRALLIYVRGDLNVHGTLHMNAKGGGGAATAITLNKLTPQTLSGQSFAASENGKQLSAAMVNLTAFSSAQPGATGGAAPTSGNPGRPGNNSVTSTGGGGSGGASAARLGAAGGTGTAWCGGAGGGGAGGAAGATASGGTAAGAGTTYVGGNGGNGQNSSTNWGNGAGGGGGAGVPPGAGGSAGGSDLGAWRTPVRDPGQPGVAGGGGTLFLVVGGSVNITGTVSANGGDGGDGGDAGGLVDINGTIYVLTDSTKPFTWDDAQVVITQNSVPRNIPTGTTLTPAEYIAAKQVLTYGTQSIALNAAGTISTALGNGGGGGGGAGGGRIVILYGGAFASVTGTITANGGVGGSGGDGAVDGQAGGAGGQGAISGPVKIIGRMVP
jgi:hypothetical protein